MTNQQLIEELTAIISEMASLIRKMQTEMNLIGITDFDSDVRRFTEYNVFTEKICKISCIG